LQHTIKKGESVWYVTGIFAKPSGADVLPSTYLDGWKIRPVIPKWVLDEMAVVSDF